MLPCSPAVAVMTKSYSSEGSPPGCSVPPELPAELLEEDPADELPDDELLLLDELLSGPSGSFVERNFAVRRPLACGSSVASPLA